MWASVVFPVLVVVFFRAMGRAGAPTGVRPASERWSAAVQQLVTDVVRGVRLYADLAAAHRDRRGRSGWAGADPAEPRPG
ncbi:hypothetical protein A7K94_0221105, partial [Modestobacter sp. VKM Ac-2676]